MTGGTGGGTTTPVVVPGTTPPPAVITTLTPRGLGLALSVGRDRLAPYRFAVSGRLTPPAGTDLCSGTVKVTVKAGARVVATRAVPLRKTGGVCTYRAAFSLKTMPSSLPKSGKLTVSARFLGTTGLAARTAPSKSVRLG